MILALFTIVCCTGALITNAWQWLVPPLVLLFFVGLANAS